MKKSIHSCIVLLEASILPTKNTLRMCRNTFMLGKTRFLRSMASVILPIYGQSANRYIMNFNVKLTRRQTEVAEFVGFGYSVKEAASFLVISYSTIKVTLKAIYSKIGIQKATELAKFVYVRRFGLDAALCEPTRKLIAMIFLCLYVSS